MAQTTIFLTGATGYIGGAVLARLLEHDNVKSFKITVLVRASEKAEKLKKFGVESLIASYADHDKLKLAASESDVVIATADADDLEATKAILEGLKIRYDKTKKAPIFIHTSGTGVLTDEALGKFAYDTVYNDADPNQIETLAPTQLHRNVDLAIVDADKQGFVKTYIILPSTIYGIARGPLVDAGISNPHSQQIPGLIKLSANRGAAAVVGEGKNLWPDVHIDDVADLYIVLYNSIISNPNTGHGREGFYFGENGEHNMLEVAQAIGKALVELGKLNSPEPKSFSDEELKAAPSLKYFGTNSRCKAERSRSIGWKPTHTTADMLASIKPEAAAILK